MFHEEVIICSFNTKTAEVAAASLLPMLTRKLENYVGKEWLVGR
jgi:hypothetical protein